MDEKYNYSGVISYTIKITDRSRSGRSVNDNQLSDDFGMKNNCLLDSIDEIIKKIDLSNGLFHVFPYNEEEKKTEKPLLYLENDGYYHFIYRLNGTISEFKVISLLPNEDNLTTKAVKIFSYLSKRFKKFKYDIEIQNKESLKGNLVVDGNDHETSCLVLYYQYIIFEKVSIWKKIFEKKSNLAAIFFLVLIVISIIVVKQRTEGDLTFGFEKNDLLLFLITLLISTLTPIISTFIDDIKNDLKIKNLKVYRVGERSLSAKETQIVQEIESLEKSEALSIKD